MEVNNIKNVSVTTLINTCALINTRNFLIYQQALLIYIIITPAFFFHYLCSFMPLAVLRNCLIVK